MPSGLELKSTTPPPSLKWLKQDRRVTAMVEWFHENFEDPAHNTPHESAEGGYQWIWGGPYHASSELQVAFFGEALPDEMEVAVRQIEAEGTFEWAPHDLRIQPDDIDDEPDELQEPSQPLEQRLAELRGQLDDLEQHIQHWSGQTPLLGHNQPPEEYRLGVTDAELDEAQESVAEIRHELDKPDAIGSADVAVLERAESRFRILARKIRGWITAVAAFVVGGAGAFAHGALGEMGKEAWADPTAFMHKLDTVANTLGVWVHHIQLPF